MSETDAPESTAGPLSLKGTMTWSDRFMVIDSNDGIATLSIYANEASFNKKQIQSERVIEGARKMGTRRTSMVPGAGATRHVIEIALAAGKKAVVAASTAEDQANWMAALRQLVGGDDESDPPAAPADAADEEAERIQAEEAAAQRTKQRETFVERFGEEQLEACKQALASADDGDSVLNKDELFKALQTLGLNLAVEHMQKLVDESDADGDGATDLYELLQIFTVVKLADDAAIKIQRSLRLLAARSSMKRAVEAVLESLAQMSALLTRGFEVLKFPRNGKAPEVRVLWLQADGTLCLDKARSDQPSKRCTRLEDIDDIVIGAEHEVFQKSAKKSTEVDGKENALVTITSSGDGASSLHFSLSAEAAAAAFAEKLRSVKSRLAMCASDDERREQAQHYAMNGVFMSAAAAPEALVPSSSTPEVVEAVTEAEAEAEVEAEVVDKCGIKSTDGKKPAYDLSYYESSSLVGKEIWYQFNSSAFLAEGEEEEELETWWALLTVKEMSADLDAELDTSEENPGVTVLLQGEPSANGKYDGTVITRFLSGDGYDWTPRSPGSDPKKLVGLSIAIRNKDSGVWEEVYVISCDEPDDSTANLSVCYRYRAEDEDNLTVDFYDSEFIWRYLLTRDADTQMDPRWEGEQLVGRKIHPDPGFREGSTAYGKTAYGTDVKGGTWNTEGFKVATYTEEETDDDGKTTKVNPWVTLEGLDGKILVDKEGKMHFEVGKEDADGNMQFHGSNWDPAEDAGAKLIGRRIALCEFGQDADGDGKSDQCQPSAWVKRPFVIAFDEETKEHTLRFQDKTEKEVGLEPNGTSSWRFLLGW